MKQNKLCGRPPQYAPAPCKLTIDLLTVKVTWITSVPILVFLGLSVLDLRPMYATDRGSQTSGAHYRLMPPTLGRGHNKLKELAKSRRMSLESRRTRMSSITF